jgi:hypothetical protein
MHTQRKARLQIAPDGRLQVDLFIDGEAELPMTLLLTRGNAAIALDGWSSMLVGVPVPSDRRKEVDALAEAASAVLAGAPVVEIDLALLDWIPAAS